MNLMEFLVPAGVLCLLLGAIWPVLQKRYAFSPDTAWLVVAIILAAIYTFVLIITEAQGSLWYFACAVYALIGIHLTGSLSRWVKRWSSAKYS
ncbi:hypothetical protein CR205_03090 [Alteribacter lacisalsi]|uniref:Uncharacterized protein n=1 Tax=Alteribacter lacisalsi TaxID=2045244 RepID=A0A2W0HJB0_9BACI|nr:hypothetical protein [Alteribacter lacisalsi]PYZ97595.1 hypothetical protein CR205_03090 [Alteribacter lacisalsi]